MGSSPSTDNLQPIRKDPFRYLRYFIYLFYIDFFQGNSKSRRLFLRRFVFRGARAFKLYSIPKFFFMLLQALRAIFNSQGFNSVEWKYRQWLWAISGLENKPYLRTWIDSRYRNGPKVIIIGVGANGDLLMITPILRALRQKLPSAQICLLHRCAAVKTILYKNPNPDSMAHADFYDFEQIEQAVLKVGAADLMVHIKTGAEYFIQYNRAPEGLRHPELNQLMPDEFFAKAEKALESWRKPITDYLSPDKKFRWSKDRAGYHLLDLFGITGNLPIDRSSKFDFHIEPDDFKILDLLPKDAPFVTVQNGVDLDVMNWSYVTGQRPTKSLPALTWRQTVALLNQKGFVTVQLGTLKEDLIEGVSLDLRGKTTFRQAAVILKSAHCQVGVEGGLVHLANAMQAISVIMFGPTSVDLFGYPQNINLTAGDCNSCWWSKRDWFIYCPRGLKEPECMNAFRAEKIVEAVLSINHPGS